MEQTNVNWIKNLVRKRKRKGWTFFYFDHMIKIDGQSTVFLLGDVTTATPLQCGFNKILTNLWRQFWSCDQSRWVKKKTSTSNFKATRLPDQVIYSIDNEQTVKHCDVSYLKSVCEVKNRSISIKKSHLFENNAWINSKFLQTF